MPRQARIDAPGALHHIIARGMERREIFYDERDRADFLHRLGRIVTESQTRCFAWALIPNHFIYCSKPAMFPWLRHASVVERLCRKLQSTSPQKWPSVSKPLQVNTLSGDVYLRELVRYIHLNPLRAGIIKTLEELDRYLYCGHSYLMGNSQTIAGD